MFFYAPRKLFSRLFIFGFIRKFGTTLSSSLIYNRACQSLFTCRDLHKRTYRIDKREWGLSSTATILSREGHLLAGRFTWLRLRSSLGALPLLAGLSVCLRSF